MLSTSNDQASYQANFKRAKVLVIEDSIDHWTLIKSALQQSLPEVTAVHVDTPAQALVLLREWVTQEWEIPKLIFQDLYMPHREDGWNLLGQIKALPNPCNRIPVVILSSSTNKYDVEKAYQLGSASYLVKPTNFEEWLTYFRQLRTYWWETVTLPPMQFSL